jgi:hypothetical protein
MIKTLVLATDLTYAVSVQLSCLRRTMRCIDTAAALALPCFYAESTLVPRRGWLPLLVALSCRRRRA